MDSKEPEAVKKKEKVENLLKESADIIVSIQVLNEIANVLIKKYGIETDVVKEHLEYILEITEVDTLTENSTFKALSLLNEYNLSYYDALIVSSALETGCSVIFSEDFQPNLDIHNKVRIVNPFVQEG